jgi:outer membrane lipoprotein-sorting protein
MRARGSQRWIAGLLAAAVLAPAAAPADGLSASEVERRWHSRLDSRHFTARLHLEMNLHGMAETRELVVYRTDEDARNERVLLCFERPPDLRDVRLLYREVPDRPNEYFLYTPSTRRVRRLPPLVADDDLYGVDLEYLGFGTSQVEPTEISSLERDTLDGREVYRLAEIARRPGARFETRITWLDPESFIPLQQELRRASELVLRVQTREVRDIQGVATPVEMFFVRPQDRREVRLRFESVDYERPLGEEVFAILNLTRRRHDLADR